MKSFLLGLGLTLTTLLASASDIAIAISPFQAKASGEVIFNQVYGLFRQVKLGDSLIILDGNGAVIATLDVRNEPPFENENIRASQNIKALRKLESFTDKMSPSGRTLGAIDVPSVLAEVARHYTDVTDIVLMGSALYDQHAQLDMTDGAYPSDDFILSPPATSVFGAKGVKYLQGKRVHWVLPEPFTESLYGKAVTRFYHIYIHALGGELVSFTANSDAVITRLLDGAAPLPFRYEVQPSGRLEMRSMPQAAVDNVEQTQFVSRTDIPVQSISASSPLVLGIQWTGEYIDLDVYARPIGGKALYYGQKRSVYGVHIKDQRTGDGDNKQFYERVEFRKPLDIDALRIGVNLYSTPHSDKKLTGTLSISLNDKTYQTRLEFDLSKGGNSGKDMRQTLDTGRDSFYSRFFTVDDIVSGGAEVASL
ncbi:hypothetical protein EYS14_00095 [Alteromonadaceae bacterium M269]|nr:hypothetical protein EYS14_00095 [Alteromonadaceae bacterium M269]